MRSKLCTLETGNLHESRLATRAYLDPHPAILRDHFDSAPEQNTAILRIQTSEPNLPQASSSVPAPVSLSICNWHPLHGGLRIQAHLPLLIYMLNARHAQINRAIENASKLPATYPVSPTTLYLRIASNPVHVSHGAGYSRATLYPVQAAPCPFHDASQLDACRSARRFDLISIGHCHKDRSQVCAHRAHAKQQPPTPILLIAKDPRQIV
ncbi:MAG TPA: hypothetical protein ENJ12_02910 [Thiolapillus brandeum]|uniref:Uncharacterized protein n=1 Tax=Thiolapillus brandeum TaxID=1076588 RepID=A0A831RVM3_9GAMM|nr:hypothetical protein [Thiolapillus brandeum]